MRPLSPLAGLGCSHRCRCVFSDTIDVQGFSHQNRAKIDSCHKAMPDKPIFESECCSCNTMRGENTGIESSDGGSNAVQKSFNADCVQSQTNASNGAPFVVGTMVWTLFDYCAPPYPSATRWLLAVVCTR